ncbi:MFS transporter, partial [Klebsiella pneumoniae]|nr:MFS transporter [Klebsiella pneumoniae]
FAPLIVMYQSTAGVSPAASQAMFVLYAVGLVPGLFVGGPLSDRRGRRAVVLGALLLSAVSSLLLMLGGEHDAWLYLGRVLAGVAGG